MEKVAWKVEGMSCTNCALTIDQYLKKQGLTDINVNFINSEVSFGLSDHKSKEEIEKGIEGLGYHVVNGDAQTSNNKSSLFKTHLQRFLFCLPFTLVLMLHMLPWHIHFLMNPWVQLLVCIPVYIVGMGYFGLSAVRSLRLGIPNMNVLISVGATAAFLYSLIGTIWGLGMDYIFYETSATIITLVFLGEWVEHRSVKATQRELNKLARSQRIMANMIAFDGEHKELIFSVDNTMLHVGDLVLIKTGEQVPVDCKVLWGEAQVNESLLTGESAPVLKQKKDALIGGSLVTDGIVKAQVTATGNHTVLSNIIDLVKQAQRDKPPIQKLADRISAVFVPAVVVISIICFLLNYFVFGITATHSLLRSIAVLVISCPCAMGLATPAAIAVGLGRAARNGILFRNSTSLELFKDIRTVIFDKTGTLTKGTFRIVAYETGKLPEPEFKRIVFSMEKYSNHPIAKQITREWKVNNPEKWKKIEEIKGKGLKAEDANGDTYLLGSHKLAGELSDGGTRSAYLLQNGLMIGWIDLADTLREGAREVIDYLHSKNINTVLLSGDAQERTEKLADLLGIKNVYAEKSPGEKQVIVADLNSQAPAAMVGDGINDAPALARATIGISMSEATDLAMQTAQVVLMNNDIRNLPLALGLGKHSFITIRENLFWAFIYNIVAIPVAAVGLLSPGIAALAMGFSDLVLAANSIRLNVKKVV